MYILEEAERLYVTYHVTYSGGRWSCGGRPNFLPPLWFLYQEGPLGCTTFELLKAELLKKYTPQMEALAILHPSLPPTGFASHHITTSLTSVLILYSFQFVHTLTIASMFTVTSDVATRSSPTTTDTADVLDPGPGDTADLDSGDAEIDAEIEAFTYLDHLDLELDLDLDLELDLDLDLDNLYDLGSL